MLFLWRNLTKNYFVLKYTFAKGGNTMRKEAFDGVIVVYTDKMERDLDGREYPIIEFYDENGYKFHGNFQEPESPRRYNGFHPGYFLGAGRRRRSGPVAGKSQRPYPLHSPQGLCLRPENGCPRRGQYQFRPRF